MPQRVAAGSGPPSVLSAFAGGDGAAVAMDRAVLAEAAEALRKLIASGAMDPVVVAGLAYMTDGSQGSLPAPTDPAGASARPLGRGSTANPAKGTTLPRDLREQLAVEQAMANPKAGEVARNVELADRRWPASEGWEKRELVVDSGGKPIKVHYVYNPGTGATDDFKIVLRGN